MFAVHAAGCTRVCVSAIRSHGSRPAHSSCSWSIVARRESPPTLGALRPSVLPTARSSCAEMPTGVTATSCSTHRGSRYCSFPANDSLSPEASPCCCSDRSPAWDRHFVDESLRDEPSVTSWAHLISNQVLSGNASTRLAGLAPRPRDLRRRHARHRAPALAARGGRKVSGIGRSGKPMEPGWSVYARITG
jgi:hypothetical protein